MRELSPCSISPFSTSAQCLQQALISLSDFVIFPFKIFKPNWTKIHFVVTKRPLLSFGVRLRSQVPRSSFDFVIFFLIWSHQKQSPWLIQQNQPLLLFPLPLHHQQNHGSLSVQVQASFQKHLLPNWSKWSVEAILLSCLV